MKCEEMRCRRQLLSLGSLKITRPASPHIISASNFHKKAEDRNMDDFWLKKEGEDHITHVSLIGVGGYGEVHEVSHLRITRLICN